MKSTKSVLLLHALFLINERVAKFGRHLRKKSCQTKLKILQSAKSNKSFLKSCQITKIIATFEGLLTKMSVLLIPMS